MSQKDAVTVHARVGHTACGKQGYTSRKAARKARSTSFDLQGGKGLAAYLCPDCGFWHLGHTGYRVTSGELSRAERYGS